MTDPLIEKLVPQRPPILMLDRFNMADDGTAIAEYTITPDNFFIDDDGRLSETGLIELMAQTASASAGSEQMARGVAEPPLGYIAEIRNFCCHRRPYTAERLLTTVRTMTEVDGVRLVKASVRVEEQTVAETQIKVFIAPEKLSEKARRT
ncbi:MAG: beta-hydroxyacyl-ACP dehydratase [Prevotella sp.]